MKLDAVGIKGCKASTETISPFPRFTDATQEKDYETMDLMRRAEMHQFLNELLDAAYDKRYLDEITEKILDEIDKKYQIK